MLFSKADVISGNYTLVVAVSTPACCVFIVAIGYLKKSQA